MRLPHFNQSTSSLSRTALRLILPAAVMIVTQTPAPCANFESWQEYLKTGEESYDKQHWGKAERYFARAVRYADRSDVGDKNLSLSLRKLGEANIAAQKYREAEAHLQRAIKVGKDCGAEDPEAIRDLLELAKTYRSVNLEQFGKNVATVLKETGLDRIEILNTKDGKSRVVVRFADKFVKHITSPDVNQINLDKKLTFDIHEDKDGTITLNNIKGLKVHSKVWANLTQSSIDPHGGEGSPTALVTAEKLGLSRTIKTVMPKPIYDRLLTVVERIKHPELHSPWHMALQERISAFMKAKQTVPVTVTQGNDEVKDVGSADEANTTNTLNTLNAIDADKATSTAARTNATNATNAKNATDAPVGTNESTRLTAGKSTTTNTQVTGDVISPVKD